jgi:predicted Zn-dependent protease
VTPQEMVERALRASRSASCIALVSESSSVNVRWAGNTLTTNGVMRSRDVTVISVSERADGPAAGVVSASVATADDLEGVVEAADAAAAQAQTAPDAAALITGDGTTVDWDLPPDETSAGVFDSFAPRLGASLSQARADEIELFGFAEHELATVYVGSTAGLRLRHVQPGGRIETTGKSHLRSRSTWVGRYVPDFADVDVSAYDTEIRQRLQWQERQIDLEPGRYETVMSPGSVADLMIYLYWTTSAREAFEGRTVFSKPGGGTRVGERLSPSGATLFSDPEFPGLECAGQVVATHSSSVSSVFDNGLPLSRTAWVDDGVLANLLQNRYSAELTGLSLTPPIDNLILQVPGGTGNVNDLVARTDRGLLLTTLWYIREVDPQSLLLTGLTRDGVYLVEAGEVVGAVNNFRFNESPVGLLERIQEAGATGITSPREWSDYFSRVAMPALRVAEFNMSTVSQAS